MIYKLKSNMYVEIALRIILWIFYIYLDFKEPFQRQIKENEIWKYQYPVTRPFVPAHMLYMIIFLVPAAMFICEFLKTNKMEDPVEGILGITLSYALTALITTFIKGAVGRPRPDFYFRCFPDGVGDDFERCAGNKESIMDGRKSFPSGHASLSFACMTFLSLYLARKFQLFQEGRRRQSWQLCVCLLPLLVAAGIAISRTCDYRHHYEDVTAGSLLGAALSYACFKLYFPNNSYTIASP